MNQFISDRILFFDGAMGTMLQKAGFLKQGEIPEMLNLTHPEVIAGIHRKYLQVGVDYIETNTFGANRIKLNSVGLGDKVKAINSAGVRIAKQEATRFSARVAASFGPTGKLLIPAGDLTFEEVYQNYLEQAHFVAEAGADLIVIETMSDILEIKAAIVAAQEVGLPTIASVSFMENERLLTGFTPEMVAAALSGFPLLALGTNCGMSANPLRPIIARMAKYAKYPLAVQPNAGKPSIENGATIYEETIDEYATACLDLINSGVSMIGGCCGTTPEHLQKLTEQFKGTPMNQRKVTEDYLVSKNGLCLVSEKNKAYTIDFSDEKYLNLLHLQNEDEWVDALFEIDSETYQTILVAGSELDDSKADGFEVFVGALTMFWPHFIRAELNSSILIKTLLTSHPGRIIVGCNGDSALISTIRRYGGLYSNIAK